MPSKEQFLEKFEEALERSQMIGAPANLLPSDLFFDDVMLRQQEHWRIGQEIPLIQALSERFHVGSGTIGAAVASALQRIPDETLELSEYPDEDGNVIYIRMSERNHVFAIGAPGFNFGD